VPWGKFGLTAFVWLMVLLFALLRGGKGGPSLVGADCGGGLYWGLFGLNLAVLFAATVHFRELVVSRALVKEGLGHQPMVGDLRWTRETTIRCADAAPFTHLTARAPRVQ